MIIVVGRVIQWKVLEVGETVLRRKPKVDLTRKRVICVTIYI